MFPSWSGLRSFLLGVLLGAGAGAALSALWLRQHVPGILRFRSSGEAEQVQLGEEGLPRRNLGAEDANFESKSQHFELSAPRRG